MNDELLKAALLEGHYVSEEALGKATTYAAEHAASLAEYLFNEELISSDTLGQAIGEHIGAPFVKLNDLPSAADLPIVPADLVKKYRLVPVRSEGAGYLVATDITDKKIRDEALAALTMPAAPAAPANPFAGKKVALAFALPDDVSQALSTVRGGLSIRFAEIIKNEKRIAPEIVDQLIKDALNLRASDIHLEPQESDVIIRLRIDGVLVEAGSVPKKYYDQVVNRIKIQAALRIDQHASSQDGAIRFRADGISADLRVSIIPTLSGEKIVMRVLAEYLRGLSLSDLGLSPEYQRRLLDFANRPFGMILTVGPTGAGKTTTLYAILKLLNEKSVNITTIEDPVEYRIPRINQVQVNAASNLTFATGLRTIVRQDPDIILVGEIRDLDTAEIAVNASLTGHLLLSTFHANDAATVVPRLIDLKIEPFLLSSTLMVVIAQRLLRRICPNCKVSESISKAQLTKKYAKVARFFEGDPVRLYVGKGCAECNNSGYKGQLGLYEFIEISPEMQQLILAKPTAPQIAALARKQGAKTLFDDGMEKVRAGFTTVDELLRVTLPSEE